MKIYTPEETKRLESTLSHVRNEKALLLQALEMYLNAGSKEQRKEAAQFSKTVYKQVTGRDYKNKNEL